MFRLPIVVIFRKVFFEVYVYIYIYICIYIYLSLVKIVRKTGTLHEDLAAFMITLLELLCLLSAVIDNDQ
jgi:hypothetical protein